MKCAWYSLSHFIIKQPIDVHNISHTQLLTLEPSIGMVTLWVFWSSICWVPKTETNSIRPSVFNNLIGSVSTSWSPWRKTPVKSLVTAARSGQRCFRTHNLTLAHSTSKIGNMCLVEFPKGNGLIFYVR